MATSQTQPRVIWPHPEWVVAPLAERNSAAGRIGAAAMRGGWDSVTQHCATAPSSIARGLGVARSDRRCMRRSRPRPASNLRAFPRVMKERTRRLRGNVLDAAADAGAIRADALPRQNSAATPLSCTGGRPCPLPGVPGLSCPVTVRVVYGSCDAGGALEAGVWFRLGVPGMLA
jgi:hypothetical protein